MKQQPNILFIMTDQHRFDCLSCMGHPLVKTPNIDRIASRGGVLFEKAYVPSPVCGPSRGALFSGQFPPGAGTTNNPAQFKVHCELFPELLQKEGYQTACVGKLHFAPEENDWGFEIKKLHDAPYDTHSPCSIHSAYVAWLRSFKSDAEVDEWIQKFNEDEEAFDHDIKQFILGRNFINESEHMTTWTADESVAFLETRDPSRPFMLYSSFFGPHQPWHAPAPWDTLYSADDITLPQLEVPTDDKPVFQRRFPESYRKEKFGLLSRREYQELIAAYYGSITMIDEHIGRILDRLEQLKLWDDTVIIFTADHGDHNGQFGLFFKSSMYESAARVPLIIKPQGKPSEARKESNGVNTLDLYGTIAELGTVQNWKKPRIESGSLVPFLKGPHNRADESVFSILRTQSMLRKGDLKLMRMGGSNEEAVYELYDLKQDPVETKNCFNDPEYTPSCSALKDELDAWVTAQNWPEKA